MPSRRLALVLVALLGCGPQVDPGQDGGGGGGTGGGAGGGTGGGAEGGGAGGGQGGGSGVRRITALALTPTTLSLRPQGVSGLTATATFSDGTQGDVSGTVQWSALPAGVVNVAVVSATDNLVSVTGVAAGTAQVTASTGTITSNAAAVTVSAPPQPDGGSSTPNLEARAVWVTRFAYNSQAEVESIIDKAAAAGFNLVYFQIRGNGDAYYRSTLVPWAKKLSGTLGKDPGWDPLQVAITRARARGLQLHAYWNVFAAWPVPSGCATAGTCTCAPAQGQSDSCVLPEASQAGAPEHFLRANPQTLAVNAQGKSQDQEYYWFNPGDPAVRAHLVAVARELLTNYQVDGLHLDRVRYPGTWASYDAVSNAAYTALPTPRPTREDWQRTNVNATVGALYDAVKQVRPQAALSASVWGIYKVLPGCSTSQGYSGYFQDSIAWMKQGLIDAINPMIYWDLGTGCTDWARHLDVFLAGANGRHVIAGMHGLDSNVVKTDRIRARIDYARQVGAAGTTLFASTYLDRAPADGGFADTWATFRAPGGPYVADAGVPPITWR